MSKFKVGDKVWYSGEVYKINEIALDENNEVCAIGLENKLDYYVDEDDLKLYKTPHERMLELGFIKEDETNYFIAYVFNGLEITIFKKEKTYQIYVHGDNYNPINLELAEVLVDYLKELRDE